MINLNNDVYNWLMIIISALNLMLNIVSKMSIAGRKKD